MIGSTLEVCFPQKICLFSESLRFRLWEGELIPNASEFFWRIDFVPQLRLRFRREKTLLGNLRFSLYWPAAAAYHDWSSEPERLKLLLLQGTRSADLLTRELAATALANVNPNDARLSDFQRVSGRAAGAAGAHTAVLVHGTFALGASWWQPGGDFHSYLLKEVRRDLYSNNDRFAWSGGWSSAARALAADDLLRWVASHKEEGLDIFTHSHGGNVAMLASTRGLQIGELVLLSCPVHPDDYAPDFNCVRKVVSIRVRLDLIILADMGGQKFADPRIEEKVLPIWFRHTATHDPSVWQNSNYGIPAML